MRTGIICGYLITECASVSTHGNISCNMRATCRLCPTGSSIWGQVWAPQDLGWLSIAQCWVTEVMPGKGQGVRGRGQRWASGQASAHFRGGEGLPRNPHPTHSLLALLGLPLGLLQPVYCLVKVEHCSGCRDIGSGTQQAWPCTLCTYTPTCTHIHTPAGTCTHIVHT